MAEYRVNLSDRRGTLPTVVEASSRVEAAAMSIAANWDQGRTLDTVSVAEGQVRATPLTAAEQSRAVTAAAAAPPLVRSGNNGFGGRRVDPASLARQREAVRTALTGVNPSASAATTALRERAAARAAMPDAPNQIAGDLNAAASARTASSATAAGTGNS